MADYRPVPKTSLYVAILIFTWRIFLSALKLTDRTILNPVVCMNWFVVGFACRDDHTLTWLPIWCWCTWRNCKMLSVDRMTVVRLSYAWCLWLIASDGFTKGLYKETDVMNIHSSIYTRQRDRTINLTLTRLSEWQAIIYNVKIQSI